MIIVALLEMLVPLWEWDWREIHRQVISETIKLAAINTTDKTNLTAASAVPH